MHFFRNFKCQYLLLRDGRIRSARSPPPEESRGLATVAERRPEEGAAARGGKKPTSADQSRPVVPFRAVMSAPPASYRGLDRILDTSINKVSRY